MDVIEKTLLMTYKFVAVGKPTAIFQYFILHPLSHKKLIPLPNRQRRREGRYKIEPYPPHALSISVFKITVSKPPMRFSSEWRLMPV